METRHEDAELISIGAMNPDGFDIEELVNCGLRFDGITSTDFVIVTRYGGPLWNVEWLDYNSTFAWDVDFDSELIAKAKHIGEVVTMDEVGKLADKGVNVFETIK